MTSVKCVKYFKFNLILAFIWHHQNSYNHKHRAVTTRTFDCCLNSQFSW